MKLQPRIKLYTLIAYFSGAGIGTQYHPILTWVCIATMIFIGVYLEDIFPETKE